jgi:hypothetical protein
MALHDEMAALVAARALARPSVRDTLAPKAAPVFTGDFSHTGTKFGVNGMTPVVKAAAITSPTAATGSYVQATATSYKTAIDAIRVALTNAGITA